MVSCGHFSWGILIGKEKEQAWCVDLCTVYTHQFMNNYTDLCSVQVRRSCVKVCYGNIPGVGEAGSLQIGGVKLGRVQGAGGTNVL